MDLRYTPAPDDDPEDEMSEEEREELAAAERDADEGRLTSHAEVKRKFATIAARIASGTLDPDAYPEFASLSSGSRRTMRR